MSIFLEMMLDFLFGTYLSTESKKLSFIILSILISLVVGISSFVIYGLINYFIFNKS